MAVASYYKTPNARELSHAAKVGDIGAIQTIAKAMARMVRKSDVLVPIPSRNGKPTTTLLLAKLIASEVGCKVAPILYGIDRKGSLYDLKKQGVDPSTVEFGYKVSGTIPNSTVLLDFVKDTGSTIRAAKQVIPNASVLVYAVVGDFPQH